jgi:hypothetical protein
MKPNRRITPAATAEIVAARHAVPHRPDPIGLRAFLAVSVAALAVIIAPRALADTGCGPGGSPPEAASKDVSDVYGQPATLWLTNTIVGITTAQGYGEAAIGSASPIERRALLIDAQQDGNHQIIVDAGREALLYTVSGCTITPFVDQRGARFGLDREHFQGQGDGIGCSDLGDGRHLVQLLQLGDGRTVRRAEIDLNGATATIGRSDTVTATSDQDPAWTTGGTISCGEETIDQDGVQAGY